MKDVIHNEDARDAIGNVLFAGLVAAAVFVAMRAFDPLIGAIRQIILTKFQ